MMEEFADLESVDDMVDWLANEEADDEEELALDATDTINDLTIDLQSLNVQVFVKLLARYHALSDEDRSHFDEATKIFSDARINMLVRHSALACMHELLLSNEEASAKQIIRKDKVYNVACEDCESGPTHMVEFKQGDRIEQHYLCDECEKAARTE